MRFNLRVIAAVITLGLTTMSVSALSAQENNATSEVDKSDSDATVEEQEKEAEPTPPDDGIKACIEAHSQTQRLRNDHKLLEARKRVIICSQGSCPQIIQEECSGWLNELKKEIPTLVISVADEEGRDSTRAVIHVDGSEATVKTGQAISLDPGPHTIEVEYNGQTQTRQITLRQGELNRQSVFSFRMKRLRYFDEFEALSASELAKKGESLHFALNIFGDTSVVASTDDRGFASALGQFGVLSTAALGSDVTAASEFVIETVEEGTIVDLERLFLQWTTSRVALRVGRLHTNLGFWNAAYHHGAWLQISVDRPRVLSFEDEGGVLPVHLTGAETDITLATLDEGSYHLVLGVGNGRGDNPDDIRVVDDTNNEKSIHTNVFYKDKSGGLQAGAGLLFDVIAPAEELERPALPDEKITELLFNAHLASFGEVFTFIVEGFHVIHSGAGETWSTTAGYALLAARSDIYVPYLRLEGVFADGGLDPFFVPNPEEPGGAIIEDIIEGVAGVRVNVSQWSSLKSEYRLLRGLDSKKNEHTLVLNWSFGI